MWSTRLSVFPSREVQVYLWMFWCGNIVLLTNKFFDVVKFTILTSLSLLSWWRPSFPIVSLKTSSLSNFALKSPNRIFISYVGKWLKTCSNSSYKLSFESSLLSSVGACTLKIKWYYTSDPSELYMTTYH